MSYLVKGITDRCRFAVYCSLVLRCIASYCCSSAQGNALLMFKCLTIFVDLEIIQLYVELICDLAPFIYHVCINFANHSNLYYESNASLDFNDLIYRRRKLSVLHSLQSVSLVGYFWQCVPVTSFAFMIGLIVD